MWKPCALLLIPLLASAAAAPARGQLPCEDIGAVFAVEASASRAVCRVNLPRTNLEVSLLGADLPAGMGLTSWAAFTRSPEGALVMGDLALTAAELPHVMAALVEAGIEITAVHRHMLADAPAMSFMHYLGTGEPMALARSLRAALERAPTVLANEPAGATASGQAGVVAGAACARIRRALVGSAGSLDTGPGYCKVGLPRADLQVAVRGIPVPPGMGIGSWFAFRETADGREAVITGDLALTAEQVNPSIRALASHGIDIVALHNHMLFDRPTVYFFHFEQRGDPMALARGLRAGLEAAGLMP